MKKLISMVAVVLMSLSVGANEDESLLQFSEVDQNQTQETNAVSSNESAQESVFSRSQKFDDEGVELYESNIELKQYKKYGLGLSSGGMTGLLGLNIEANIAPEEAFVASLGFGQIYNSFALAWKHNYEAQYLSPYYKVGYANWFNTNKYNNRTVRSDILDRVLSQKQIEENKFSAHFLSAGIGLEYNQLEGELAGVNFYGELLIMGELNSNVYLPTAGLGLTYFY